MRIWLPLALGVIALLVSMWGFLWMISSASLASGYCKGDFSLFHEAFRCRQPYLAMILFGVFLIVSAGSFWVAWRRRK
jgi:hypothetical protein